jgi:NAD(P)-dependent dehydrogenase (short-subunit alcohol dehydrogenase family)
MSLFATYPSLAGRRVFITGGASGIGAAMARLSAIAIWRWMPPRLWQESSNRPVSRARGSAASMSPMWRR